MAKLNSAAALVAYAETLFQEGRVLLVGNSASGLAALFLERGAASVHVWDPNPTRAAAARSNSSGIVVEALTERASRAAGFDLLFVEDLKSIREPAELLRRGKRSLARRGVALIVCDNVDAEARLSASVAGTSSDLDYYSLYDSVADEFPVVRMLGQAPFVGYAVADFAVDEAPVPSVDTSLLKAGAEQPEAFVALASFEPVKLEAFSLIQLPLAELQVAHATGVNPSQAAEQLQLSEERTEREAAFQKATQELVRAKAEIASARENASTLQTQNESGIAELAEARGMAEKAKAEARSLADKAQIEARSVAEKAKAEARSLVDKAQIEARGAVDKAQMEARSLVEKAQIEARGAVDKAQIEARGAVEKAQAETRSLAEQSRAEAEQRVVQLSELEAVLAAQAQRLAFFEQLKEIDASGEISRFEDQLRTQSGELQRLEAELSGMRTVGRGLALELEILHQSAAKTEMQSVSPEAELEHTELKLKLAEAQKQAAVREADYQVLLWTIERLEEKLGLGSAVSDDPAREAASALKQRQSALGHQLKVESRTS